MKKIPLIEPVFQGNEQRYVADCIKSTWISRGKYIDTFEEKFAKFCEAKYATTVVNGTAALHLLLASMRIKEGDEVILPTLTFIATANAISYLRARPVFVDSELETWNIDPKKIEAAITKKTKAIIVVHIYGHPANMGEIENIAKKHEIMVIEDACEAHGARYKGKRVGSLGKASVFSFYGNKIITTGEGGMIVSNDQELIKRANYLKSQAMEEKGKYFHNEIGYNYRFTNLQASIGLAQLENIEKVIAAKKRNARIYTSLLKNSEYIILPPEKPWAENVFWLYSIIVNKQHFRNKLILFLQKEGVETRPFFEPIHTFKMYKTDGDFKQSEFLGSNGLSLPSSYSLTEKEIRFICHKIIKFLKG